MNYLEIELSDGTRARWEIPKDEDADTLKHIIEVFLNQPATIVSVPAHKRLATYAEGVEFAAQFLPS